MCVVDLQFTTSWGLWHLLPVLWEASLIQPHFSLYKGVSECSGVLSSLGRKV